MIIQRFFADGDPADPAAWRCRGCGAKFANAAMKHSDACPQIEGQELRKVIQAQKADLEQKDRELAALHIWGDPGDEIVRAEMAVAP